MAIGESSTVKMHYTLKLDSGEVLDSTEEGSPFEFKIGEGSVIPGLEKSLEGMEKGEERHIEVPPEEAFGVRNPEAVVCIPREEFPAETPVQTGMIFRLQKDDGMMMHVTVVDMTEKDLTLDLNHPLAGETLHFDVKIVEISQP